MPLAALDKKAFVFSGGADEFLKGLSSNTPDAPKSAFLDTQGRIVATFDQARLAPDAVLAVVEAPFAARLSDHLSKFLLLSGCVMTERPELNVSFDLDGTLMPAAGDVRIPQKKGAIVVSVRPPKPDADADALRLFRVRHAIPLQGADYDREMLLNLGDPGYVSFDKGCFLGQEIVARVHYRGKPPKKLVVKRLSQCTEAEAAAMTSRVNDPAAGEPAGFVFAANEAFGAVQ